MTKKLFFIFTLLIIYTNSVFGHIDVVYPKEKKSKINSESAFFFGNTTKNSQLYINNKKIKLWNNDFFVEVVPLKYGKNIITLKSIFKGKEENVTYEIRREKPTKIIKSKEIKFEPKNEDEIWYTKTIKENATIREKGSQKSKRVIDVPTNIILYLSGKQGEYYKIEEKGETEFWIHKSNIEVPVNLSKKTVAKLKDKKLYEDELYRYVKFYLSHPVLYTIKQEKNTLKLTLYGVETKQEDESITDNLEYEYSSSHPILGYEGCYDENTFIFKIRKQPVIDDISLPLKGIKIFVDAGHGGNEKGAIGPTRINEKDINLSISQKLTNMLREEGAEVTNSRIDDKKVGLYERVEIAKENDALISICIHNNSLPIGKNPYNKHGSEVHYYNENAKLLSEIIQKDLVENLKIKDGGIHYSSFVLNRSTNPVSVLIEIAYMINPEEYILLQTDEFQDAAANSIKNSIKKYIIIVTNNKNMI